MKHVLFPLVSVILGALFLVLAWYAKTHAYATAFWIVYVLLLIAIFVFELSSLTFLLDLLRSSAFA